MSNISKGQCMNTLERIGRIALWICALSIVVYGATMFVSTIHAAEASIHERVGAERQKQRNFVATQQYRRYILQLERENRLLKYRVAQSARRTSNEIASQ
jgi:hypothetical protein